VAERDALDALLREAAVEPQIARRLAQYGALLLEANKRINLTGAHTPEDLLPHLLDSVCIVPYVQGPLVDIGSGGGLPAVPVAIATGVPLTLIEATTKKAAFLEAVLGALGLQARVVPQRAEIAGRDPDLREQFASATARAVSNAATVLELAAPFLRIEGMAVLQRGRMDERDRNALIDAAPMLGAQVEREILLAGERRIVLVRKTGPTPPRFPRRTGVPQKRPLRS
jgi:16S rRNA (guanine527-N7)-methyltransferase